MRFTIPLIALLLASGLARAGGCETSAPELTLETPAGTFYVDNDLCQLDGSCLFSIWIYQETNGQPGLQRGDETCVDESCNCDGMETDTIVL
jgi:hypothetical protein